MRCIYSMNSTGVNNAIEQRGDGVKAAHINYVAFRRYRRRYVQGTAMWSDAKNHSSIVVIHFCADRPLIQSITATLNSPNQGYGFPGALKIKAVMWRAGFERCAAAVEVRLLQIRAVVLGAERVAVAAVVAVVGEVGDLVGLLRARRRCSSPMGIDAAIGPDFDVAIRQPQFAGVVGEVGVVRADGNALVARDAVERHEVRIDFLGHGAILGRTVTRVGLRFGDDDRRVEEAGLHRVAAGRRRAGRGSRG